MLLCEQVFPTVIYGHNINFLLSFMVMISVARSYYSMKNHSNASFAMSLIQFASVETL